MAWFALAKVEEYVFPIRFSHPHVLVALVQIIMTTVVIQCSTITGIHCTKVSSSVVCLTKMLIFYGPNFTICISFVSDFAIWVDQGESEKVYADVVLPSELLDINVH